MLSGHRKGESHHAWLLRECENMRVRIYKREQRIKAREKLRCEWCGGTLLGLSRRYCSKKCRKEVDVVRRFNQRRRDGLPERSIHLWKDCLRRIELAAMKHVNGEMSQSAAAREFQVSVQAVHKKVHKILGKRG